MARLVHQVLDMASSYPVFPEITLVVDGVPRRIRSLIPLSPAEMAARPRKRPRAWPIYLAAIVIGIGVGLVTKSRAHHAHATAALQSQLH